MERIRVLLVDDQVLFINSLKTVLEIREKEIQIIGVCYNGQEAIEFCKKRVPDVILMDVKMPEVNGVHAAKEILSTYPAVHIIMLTTFQEDEFFKGALELGAKGYLLKDMLPEDLIFAIKNVAKGMVSISPSIIQHSMRRKRPADEPEWLSQLERMEVQILKLITHGYNNKEISQEVNLAEQTVKNYITIIYEKMDVRDRMQAMRTCIDLKLFEE